MGLVLRRGVTGMQARNGHQRIVKDRSLQHIQKQRRTLMAESTTDARDLFVSREVRNWLSEIRISDTEMTRSQEDFVKFQIDEAYGKRINLGLRRKFERKQEIRSRKPKD